MRIIEVGNPTAPTIVLYATTRSSNQSVRQEDWRTQFLCSILNDAGYSQEGYWRIQIEKERREERLDTHLNEIAVRIQGRTTANTLVVCGKELCVLLCGVNSLEKWRGSVIESMYFPNLKVIPTLDPEEVFRTQYHMKYVMQKDCERAKKESTTTEKSTPAYHFIFPQTAEEVMSYLSLWEGKSLAAVDIETYVPLRISCLSIAPTETEAISIPFESSGKLWWHPKDEEAIRLWINRYLQHTQFVMQNALYDLFVFRWVGYSVPADNLYMDTMLAHACLYPEFPHSLDFLCSLYTDQPYYKDEGKPGHASYSYRQLRAYNCKDAVCTLRIAGALEKELRYSGMYDFYREYYNALIPPLLQSSVRGIPVNLTAHRQLIEKYEAKKTAIETEIQAIAGHPVNTNSPKQLKELISRACGISLTDKEPMNETTLRRVRQKSGDERIQKVIDLKRIKKILSSYLRFTVDHDIRVRYSFQLTGSRDERILMSQSATGSGIATYDAYALPDIRRLFIAENGYLLAFPGYRHAEIYIVAMLADEEQLLAMLASHTDEDIYTQIAAFVLYQKAVEEITPQERSIARRVIDAAHYGMQWKSLQSMLWQDDLYVPAKEVKRILQAYHNKFPKIASVFHARIARELRNTRSLLNPLGRRRTFYGKFDHHLMEKGYAYIPQSTVSDMVKEALVKISLRFPVLGQQDDSLCVLVPEGDDREEQLTWIAQCLERPIALNGRLFQIPIEMRCGFNMNRHEWECV